MNFEQLKERSNVIFGTHPLTDEEIRNVEVALDIKLAQEFNAERARTELLRRGVSE